jgi:hypothetical protein
VVPVTTIAEPVALATTTKTRQRTTKPTSRPAASTTTARSAKKTGAAQPKTVTTRPQTATVPPTAATTRARKNVTPAALPTCTASVDNRTPAAGESVVVTVASILPGTPFTVTAHYKSKDKRLSGVTDGAGAGAVTFDIGAATKGYTVKVDVSISDEAMCSSEFTPQ